MNPALDKIRKLLRLSKCSAATPAEAAAALAKAIQLAGEHGIDLTAIPPDDPERGGMTHVTERSDAGTPHRLASRIVKRHFGVATLFDSTGEKKVIHFIGGEMNCQLASYCYIYLVRASRAAWRKRENRRLRDRESFLHGYFAAIDRMMPATFHREGLILSTGKNRLSESAFHHGVSAGRRDGIRDAIRGTDKPLIS